MGGATSGMALGGASGGGKSSGLGQGGYGAAPAFNRPSTPSSVNTTTDADMRGGNRYGMPPQSINQVMQGLGMGGKSSGMGQGGYQSAPAYGGYQQQMPQQMMPQQMIPQQQMYQQMPQQQMYQQQMRQQMPQQFSPYGGGYQQQGGMGMQGLYNSMMGQYQPMRQMQPMPQYGQYNQGNPLSYRPDIAAVQQNLNRVKPSVQKQAEDAQAARIAELEAQLAKYNTPSGE